MDIRPFSYAFSCDSSTVSDEKSPTQALCLGGDGVYAMIVQFSL